MLNQDALPGRIGIAELTSEFRRIARRSKTLRDDVGENLDDDAQLQPLIENNPIAAWCGGKGTGGPLPIRGSFPVAKPEQDEARE